MGQVPVMFPYMDSIYTPTPAEVSAAAKRVQALDTDDRNDLLFRLLGRMLVRDYATTIDEIADMEAGR